MSDNEGDNKDNRSDLFTIEFRDLILIEKGTGPTAAEIRRKWERDQRKKRKKSELGDNDTGKDKRRGALRALRRTLNQTPCNGAGSTCPHSGINMSAKGLEPLTNGLKGHCSTIELRAQSERILSWRYGNGKEESLLLIAYS
jgi:hypothetical protein